MVHHLEGKPLRDTLSPGDVFLGEVGNSAATSDAPNPNPNPDPNPNPNPYQVGNEKDYIATRVSYALDLMGPSLAVNSACSSALAAVAH